MNTCESCNIALAAEPVRAGDRLYCCAGCVDGGPCVCTYEHDPRCYPPAHYARRVSLADLLEQYERAMHERT